MTINLHAALRNTIRAVSIAVLAVTLAGCAGYRAAGLYRDGTADLNAGRHERAVVQLREAAELEPTSSEIQNHLGLALAASGQHEAALLAFERAVALDCDNAAAAVNLEAARVRLALETVSESPAHVKGRSDTGQAARGVRSN